MMITPSQTWTAISVLKRKPDKSNANKQARENAKHYLKEYLKQTSKFKKFAGFAEQRKVVQNLLKQ